MKYRFSFYYLFLFLLIFILFIYIYINIFLGFEVLIESHTGLYIYGEFQKAIGNYPNLNSDNIIRYILYLFIFFIFYLFIF